MQYIFLFCRRFCNHLVLRISVLRNCLDCFVLHIQCHLQLDTVNVEGESKHLKTNATVGLGCLVYHSNNPKLMNIYGSKSVASPDVRNISHHDTVPKITAQGKSMLLLLRNTTQIMEGQHQRMYRPVIVVIAAHRRWQKLIGYHYSGGICWSSPTMLGRHKSLLIS